MVQSAGFRRPGVRGREAREVVLHTLRVGQGSKVGSVAYPEGWAGKHGYNCSAIGGLGK